MKAQGLMVFVLAVASVAVLAEGWHATLQQGGEVYVDPQTRKPVYRANGISKPLWNGTHRLQDGSVLIVRDGVAVPDTGMLRTWEQQQALPEAGKNRYCEQLALKACGFHDECRSLKACDLARQLRRLEQDALAKAPYGQLASETLDCKDGLTDPGRFPWCPEPAARPSPCEALVQRTCGKDGRCAAAPACDAARQLMDMERTERLESTVPDAVTATGKQCRAARDNAYFAPCEKVPAASDKGD